MNNKRSFIAIFLVLFSVELVFSQQTATVTQKYNLGQEAQSEENFYLAQQYYLEVVAINPAFSKAWYSLAECSYKLGEFELAQNYLQNAQKYESANSDVLNLKGKILVSLGNLNEAKTLFNDILKKYPNDIEAHFGLAEIELYEGRYSGAEKQYNEALKRQANNRNALLALSLINAERNKFSDAEKYLKQALNYFSGDPEVHYLAAVIYSMKGDYKTAENQARIAVEINGNLEKAYELLTTVLYKQKRYQEVLDLSDFLIARNRKNATAWYLKGIAYSKLGQTTQAINVWSSGLSAQPQDEIMRMAMELEIRNLLTVEDKKRSLWSNYHVENAKQYKSRYDGSGAVYEYQRALLLDPNNYEARKAYADIIELNGMYELYLDQLKFMYDHNADKLKGKALTNLTDKIESYESLLSSTLAKKWKVEPFYLDKTRWNIAIFYEDNTSSFIHADINNLAARACADIFSGVAITSVKTQAFPVSGYGEAFKNARTNNYDYFIIVSLSEGANDLTLSSTIYNGRTGLEIEKNSFYSTGNNRFSTVLRRFRKSVLDKLPVRGKILARNGKTVLVDLGKSENITKNAQFHIVKKDALQTADNEYGLFYSQSDLYGTLTITNASEEVSEGVIENMGFYDRVNIDDEVVLISLPSQNSQQTNPIDTVPVADENGNTVVESEIKGQNLINDIKKSVEKPSILELLRNIY